MTSRAKISPKPSMTPLMNGKTMLIPTTAAIRERERCPEPEKRDRVKDGGCCGCPEEDDEARATG